MSDGGRRETARSVDVLGAARALGARIGGGPRIHLVLGSGLGPLAEAIDEPVVVPFQELPGLPAAGVAGHAGRFLAGRLEGRAVLVQSGRYHLYEGWPAEVVAAPVRIAAAVGAEVTMLTNAAGGIGRHLEPGALVLLDDHLNLQFRNPLTGPLRAGEPRFPDMSAPYDPGLAGEAMAAASRLGIRLHRGTYAALTGPSYETPAEIRALARAGADVVGMSTVPSVVAARSLGLRVVAVSVVTNRAAGLSDELLSHEEVVETGRRAGATLERLIREILSSLPG